MVVRHSGSGGLVDTAYEVKTNQELKGQADGPISFDIKRQHIFIDASAGGVGAIVLGTPEQIETIQRLQAFDDDMRAADLRGDSGYELDRIDPAVLEIYSRDECARTFSRPIAVPKIRVVTYSGPKSITYTAAGRGTVTIPRGYEVQIQNDLYPEFTFQYIGERSGQLSRFGECFQ